MQEMLAHLKSKKQNNNNNDQNISLFVRYQVNRSKISHACRVYENNNISWLQVSWDITPGPQWSKYLSVRGILHHIHNIPGLQNLWDVSQKQQYLMVANFVKYYTNTTISHSCRFCEILHWRQQEFHSFNLMVSDLMR